MSMHRKQLCMAKSCEDFIFPTEFPFEFDSVESNSSLNSPLGSAASTETQSSDEVDLARRFAQFSLHNHQNHNLDAFIQKSIGSTKSQASCNASFNSQNTWDDLIYAAAAAEVARKASQSMGNVHGCMQSPPFYSNSVLGLTNQNHEEMLKQQQLLAMYERQGKMNWQESTLRQLRQQRACEFESGRYGHFLLLGQPGLARLSTLQVQKQLRLSALQVQKQLRLQQISADAGFQVKKKCAGTGFFLPRKYENPPEAPKRSECSTASLPAKVVQAQLYAQPESWFKGGQVPNHGQLSVGSMVGHGKGKGPEKYVNFFSGPSNTTNYF